MLASRCVVTTNAFERVRGLLGRESLANDEALLIEPCNSIHTFFMKFPIDVAYLKRDREGVYKVVLVRSSVKPYRLDWPHFGVAAVLEGAAGAFHGIQPGDLLCLS